VAQTKPGKPNTPRTHDFPTDEPPAGASELGPGVRVGDYVIERQIGEGGMGMVFAAVHPVIGKHVAIKVLSPMLAGDATSVQRFVQEARAVNQIAHPKIVDIFGFGQLPSGRHYCVMELLHGQSLKRRLDSPIDDREAISIIAEVCEALAAAHAAGIVHRDLKPDNIFLVEDTDGTRRVKLLDFGIAKLLEDPEALKTRSGEPIGTPRYMAPEQRQGKPVDLRTDLYALGVMMFEIFGGRELPGMTQLIHACLAENPDARPQTATEVRARLLALAPPPGMMPTPTPPAPTPTTPPPTPPTAGPTTPASPQAVPPPRMATWVVVMAVFAAIALPVGLVVGVYELLAHGMVIAFSSKVGFQTNDAGQRIGEPHAQDEQEEQKEARDDLGQRAEEPHAQDNNPGF
jgi:serine/threonine-protein kinase